MKRVLTSLTGLLLTVLMVGTATFSILHAEAQQVLTPVQEELLDWEFEKGDWIVANVAENTLQFVREDYSDVSVRIRMGSGKLLEEGESFSYLGMKYDPKTPEKVWEIRSKQQQNWFNVFGSQEANEQLFLRLYEVKGEQRIWTHYGIHTTPNIEQIFEEEAGYGSWGCVLTRYELLKQIEALYELNDKNVRVVTTKQNAEDLVSVLKAF